MPGLLSRNFRHLKKSNIQSNLNPAPHLPIVDAFINTLILLLRSLQHSLVGLGYWSDWSDYSASRPSRTYQRGFIHLLPLILLAAFALTTFVIVGKVQKDNQDVRSRAVVDGPYPANYTLCLKNVDDPKECDTLKPTEAPVAIETTAPPVATQAPLSQAAYDLCLNNVEDPAECGPKPTTAPAAQPAVTAATTPPLSSADRKSEEAGGLAAITVTQPPVAATTTTAPVGGGLTSAITQTPTKTQTPTITRLPTIVAEPMKPTGTPRPFITPRFDNEPVPTVKSTVSPAPKKVPSVLTIPGGGGGLASERTIPVPAALQKPLQGMIDGLVDWARRFGTTPTPTPIPISTPVPQAPRSFSDVAATTEQASCRKECEGNIKCITGCYQSAAATVAPAASPTTGRPVMGGNNTVLYWVCPDVRGILSIKSESPCGGSPGSTTGGDGALPPPIASGPTGTSAGTETVPAADTVAPAPVSTEQVEGVALTDDEKKLRVSAEVAAGQESAESSGSLVISDAAKAMRASQTSRCAVDLGLCPMIDPTTLKVVGWVPAKEAVFGTFQDAKLGRLNVSIGSLRDEGTGIFVADKDGGTVRDTLGKDYSRIRKLVQENQIEVSENGVVAYDDKGDIKLKNGKTLSRDTLINREEAFNVQQEAAQQKLATSLADNIATFQKDCAAQHADKPCTPDQLNAFILASSSSKASLLSPNALAWVQSYVTDSVLSQAYAYNDISAMRAICRERENITNARLPEATICDTMTPAQLNEYIYLAISPDNRTLAQQNRDNYIDLNARMEIAYSGDPAKIHAACITQAKKALDSGVPFEDRENQILAACPGGQGDISTLLTGAPTESVNAVLANSVLPDRYTTYITTYDACIADRRTESYCKTKAMAEATKGLTGDIASLVSGSITDSLTINKAVDLAIACDGLTEGMTPYKERGCKALKNLVAGIDNIDAYNANLADARISNNVQTAAGLQARIDQITADIANGVYVSEAVRDNANQTLKRLRDELAKFLKNNPGTAEAYTTALAIDKAGKAQAECQDAQKKGRAAASCADAAQQLFALDPADRPKVATAAYRYSQGIEFSQKYNLSLTLDESALVRDCIKNLPIQTTGAGAGVCDPETYRQTLAGEVALLIDPNEVEDYKADVLSVSALAPGFTASHNANPGLTPGAYITQREEAWNRVAPLLEKKGVLPEYEAMYRAGDFNPIQFMSQYSKRTPKSTTGYTFKISDDQWQEVILNSQTDEAKLANCQNWLAKTANSGKDCKAFAKYQEEQVGDLVDDAWLLKLVGGMRDDTIHEFTQNTLSGDYYAKAVQEEWEKTNWFMKRYLQATAVLDAITGNGWSRATRGSDNIHDQALWNAETVLVAEGDQALTIPQRNALKNQLAAAFEIKDAALSGDTRFKDVKAAFIDDPDWLKGAVLADKADALTLKSQAEKLTSEATTAIQSDDLGTTSEFDSKKYEQEVTNLFAQAYSAATETDNAENVAAYLRTHDTVGNIASGVDVMDNEALARQVRESNTIQGAAQGFTNAVANEQYLNGLSGLERAAVGYINWTHGAAAKGEVLRADAVEKLSHTDDIGERAKLIGQWTRGTIIGGGKLYGTLAAVAVPVAGLAGTAAAGTAITGQTFMSAAGTGLGQYLAGESWSGTAEVCGGKHVDTEACARSAAMTVFMTASAIQGGVGLLKGPAAANIARAEAIRVAGGPTSLGEQASVRLARLSRLGATSPVPGSVPSRTVRIISGAQGMLEQRGTQLGLNAWGVGAFGAEAAHVCGTEGFGVNCAIQAGFTGVTFLRTVGRLGNIAGASPQSGFNRAVAGIDLGVNGLLSASSCAAAAAGAAPGESCATAAFFLSSAVGHMGEAFAKPGSHGPGVAKVEGAGKWELSAEAAAREIKNLHRETIPTEGVDITYLNSKGESQTVRVRADNIEVVRGQIIDNHASAVVARQAAENEVLASSRKNFDEKTQSGKDAIAARDVLFKDGKLRPEIKGEAFDTAVRALTEANTHYQAEQTALREARDYKPPEKPPKGVAPERYLELRGQHESATRALEVAVRDGKGVEQAREAVVIAREAIEATRYSTRQAEIQAEITALRENALKIQRDVAQKAQEEIDLIERARSGDADAIDVLSRREGAQRLVELLQEVQTGRNAEKYQSFGVDDPSYAALIENAKKANETITKEHLVPQQQAQENANKAIVAAAKEIASLTQARTQAGTFTGKLADWGRVTKAQQAVADAVGLAIKDEILAKVKSVIGADVAVPAVAAAPAKGFVARLREAFSGQTPEARALVDAKQTQAKLTQEAERLQRDQSASAREVNRLESEKQVADREVTKLLGERNAALTTATEKSARQPELYAKEKEALASARRAAAEQEARITSLKNEPLPDGITREVRDGTIRAAEGLKAELDANVTKAAKTLSETIAKDPSVVASERRLADAQKRAGDFDTQLTATRKRNGELVTAAVVSKMDLAAAGSRVRQAEEALRSAREAAVDPGKVERELRANRVTEAEYKQERDRLTREKSALETEVQKRTSELDVARREAASKPTKAITDAQEVLRQAEIRVDQQIKIIEELNVKRAKGEITQEAYDVIIKVYEKTLNESTDARDAAKTALDAAIEIDTRVLIAGKSLADTNTRVAQVTSRIADLTTKQEAIHDTVVAQEAALASVQKPANPLTRLWQAVFPPKATPGVASRPGLERERAKAVKEVFNRDAIYKDALAEAQKALGEDPASKPSRAARDTAQTVTDSIIKNQNNLENVDFTLKPKGIAGMREAIADARTGMVDAITGRQSKDTALQARLSLVTAERLRVELESKIEVLRTDGKPVPEEIIKLLDTLKARESTLKLQYTALEAKTRSPVVRLFDAIDARLNPHSPQQYTRQQRVVDTLGELTAAAQAFREGVNEASEGTKLIVRQVKDRPGVFELGPAEGKELPPAIQQHVTKVNELIRRMETELGKKKPGFAMTGPDNPSRADQSRIIFDALFDVTKGTGGVLYEGAGGLGKSSFIINAIADLKANLTGTKVTVLAARWGAIAADIMQGYPPELHAQNGVLAAYYNASEGSVTYVEPNTTARRTVFREQAAEVMSRANVIYAAADQVPYEFHMSRAKNPLTRAFLEASQGSLPIFDEFDLVLKSIRYSSSGEHKMNVAAEHPDVVSRFRQIYGSEAVEKFVDGAITEKVSRGRQIFDAKGTLIDQSLYADMVREAARQAYEAGRKPGTPSFEEFLAQHGISGEGRAFTQALDAYRKGTDADQVFTAHLSDRVKVVNAVVDAASRRLTSYGVGEDGLLYFADSSGNLQNTRPQLAIEALALDTVNARIKGAEKGKPVSHKQSMASIEKVTVTDQGETSTWKQILASGHFAGRLYGFTATPEAVALSAKTNLGMELSRLPPDKQTTVEIFGGIDEKGNVIPVKRAANYQGVDYDGLTFKTVKDGQNARIVIEALDQNISDIVTRITTDLSGKVGKVFILKNDPSSPKNEQVRVFENGKEVRSITGDARTSPKEAMEAELAKLKEAGESFVLVYTQGSGRGTDVPGIFTPNDAFYVVGSQTMTTRTDFEQAMVRARPGEVPTDATVYLLGERRGTIALDDVRKILEANEKGASGDMQRDYTDGLAFGYGDSVKNIIDDVMRVQGRTSL